MSDRRRLLRSAANALDSDYIENVRITGIYAIYALHITAINDTERTHAGIRFRNDRGDSTYAGFYIPALKAGVETSVTLGRYSKVYTIAYLQAFDIDDDFIIKTK